MRDYNDRISEAYGLPVVSLALLADEHPNWRPRHFRQQLQGTVKEFIFRTAKLLDHVVDIDALEASSNPIAWVTLAHWLTQQAHHDPDKLYAAKVHLTRLLPDPYHQRYLRAISRLEKEHEMREYNQLEQTFIDNGIKIGLKQGIEKGIEKGIEQGLQRGRKEEAVLLLERQLELRFGPLPQTARKKLAKASVAQLEAWSDAFVVAQSLKQVFG
ncbi:DUF4351 domain-containing protein [Duganella radicis]|uniref:DUF4351 domain-containing protein n=1 Tax=Duganella radicis TaxID=551988 RepID=A0A6L6PDU2_9BURK|nr:DUF4351 domain-containing protein [Duganella radicis]MTV37174.1 DUF4351 domain-containing protein [Duganella radicis]